MMITEQFVEKAEMPSYTRRSCPSADSDMRLQVGYWAHFPQQIPPTQGNAIPKRECKIHSAKKTEKHDEVGM
jgi:hypothetical protein